MHISSVIKISFCRISFSGHQNKFCACLDSIYGSRVMCKNCSDIRWHRLNSNQSKTNCPKNLNSDGLIVREMGPWPECIFRSLLQFLVILYWKGFTSIFQDDDCRPYWVLLNSKIEEWSHLVNLLVRSTCTLALRMELESSSDTVASKVYSVIWNKVTLGEYL